MFNELEGRQDFNHITLEVSLPVEPEIVSHWLVPSVALTSLGDDHPSLASWTKGGLANICPACPALLLTAVFWTFPKKEVLLIWRAMRWPPRHECGQQKNGPQICPQGKLRLQMELKLLIHGPWHGKMTLDSLSEPHIIIRFLKCERRGRRVCVGRMPRKTWPAVAGFEGGGELWAKERRRTPGLQEARRWPPYSLQERTQASPQLDFSPVTPILDFALPAL